MTAKDALLSSNGKFVTVAFRKKDGSKRVLNGRLGVSKHVTGGGMPYDPGHYNMQVIYDVKAKGYRMVNLDEIIYTRIGGKIYI